MSIRRMLVFLLAVSLLLPAVASHSRAQQETYGYEEHKLRNLVDDLKTIQILQDVYKTQNGCYGTLDELAGLVSYYYKNSWIGLDVVHLETYFNEDKTDYLITAFTKVDFGLIGLGVGPRTGVLAIIEPDNPNLSTERTTQFLDTEEQFLTQTGEYDFIEEADNNFDGNSVLLYLNEQKDKFIINFNSMWVEDFTWISETSKSYVLEDFNPDIGLSNSENLEFRMLVSRPHHAASWLSAIGQMELQDYDYNKRNQYKSFRQLQDDQWISEGYTPDNFILGYKLLLGLTEDQQKFMAIALPVENVDLIPTYMIPTTLFLATLIPIDSEIPDSWRNIDPDGELPDDIHPDDFYYMEDSDTYALFVDADPGMVPDFRVYLSFTDTLYSVEPVIETE